MERFFTTEGPYRLLFCAGRTLAPDAVDTFARAVCTEGADLLYADERIVGPDGRTRTVRKPPWSPDTLLSCNYIGSPVAVSETLLMRAGPPRFDAPGERYAFLLRAARKANGILHLPRVLCTGNEEPVCDDPDVVTQALRERGVRGYAADGPRPGTFCVRYFLPEKTRVSGIIWNLGTPDAVRLTLESAACRCTYPYLEWLVADGGAPALCKERYYASLEAGGAARVIRPYCETNVPRLLNRAARAAGGDVLLFLPAGAALAAGDEVERMLELALLPHTGLVCGVSPPSAGAIIRNVEIASRYIMLRSDRFFSVGGFDETFASSGYCAALSFALRAKRLHNVQTPYAVFSQRMPCPAPAPDAVNRARLSDLQSIGLDL